MLNKEYNHLLKCCKKLQSASKGIKHTLNKLLSDNTRSFVVSFNGVEYNFFTPTTYEEIEQQENLKEVFIQELLLKSYKDMFENQDWDISDGNDCWDTILVFAMGEPIETYQLEKICESTELHHENAIQTETSKQIPLNEDSVYVQWQDQNKHNFDDERTDEMITEKKVVSVEEHLQQLKNLHAFMLKNLIEAKDRPVDNDKEIMICVFNDDGSKTYIKPEDGETNQEFNDRYNKIQTLEEQEILDYIDRLINNDANIVQYTLFDPKKFHQDWIEKYIERDEEHVHIYDFHKSKLKDFCY